MKRWMDAAVGLGITAVALTWSLEPFLEDRHNNLYHWMGSASGFYCPILLLFLGCWLLVSLLLRAARVHPRFQKLLWIVLLAAMPLLAAKDVFARYPKPMHHGSAAIALPCLLALVCVSLLAWRPAGSVRSTRLINAASTILAFVGVSGALLLCQLGLLWGKARHLNSARSMHLRQPHDLTLRKARIIWIVLDELSYEQVYENRFHSLDLPAFDALAQQASVMTHTRPAGLNTEQVMPTLLTGEPIDLVRSGSDGALWIHNVTSGGWQPFQPQQTVFQDALRFGYRTALVGWYNPYCRILPAVLDSCTWSFQVATENGLRPGSSLGANVAQIFLTQMHGQFFRRLLSPFVQVGERVEVDPELHIRDYQFLNNRADQVLDDASSSFVLLHLPIPHPGGIYNRTTGNITTGPSSYIDNLALADRYVGHVQALLKTKGEWDTSTVLIMGDHSWRTRQLWRNFGGWTAEDEEASSHGSFDSRPFYLVKLPGQQTPVSIDTPICAAQTRLLLDALMQGQILSTKSLVDWVQQSSRNDTLCLKLAAVR